MISKISENSDHFIEANNSFNFKEHEDDSNISFISKRVLSELVKCENQNDISLSEDIANRVDDLVDVILNETENKPQYIRNFICYIIDIKSEILKLLQDYENLNEEFNLRFIVTAKNIYMFALEVFCSINDLYKIDINNVMKIFRKKFPFKFDEK